MRKIKVLVLSHMYPNTANEVGGIFVQQQVKALEELGVDIKVVSPKPWTPFPINRLTKKWKEYDKIPKQETREGIQVYYPRYLTFPRNFLFHTSGTRMYWGIRRLVDRIKKDFDFDLIHAHVALPDGFVASKLGDDIDVPFVVTIHGQDAYVTIDLNEPCKERVAEVFGNSRAVMAVSNRLKDVLISELGSRFNSKIEIIENGISLDKVVEKNEINLGKFPEISDNKTTILSVGYLIQRKAHRYVLNALHQLHRSDKDFQYIVIGDGPKQEELVELTKKYNLQENVSFLGLLPHKEVMKYMRLSDIFVLPSWDEAFGMVYPEAMVHNTPVIGCRGEGVEDFVEHEETGLLVEPKDVKSLANAIKYLMDHPDKAAEMGKRAREVVRDNYTWQKNAEKTINVYKEVLDGKE